MTASNIPDGVSFGDLQKMLESAPVEGANDKGVENRPFNGKTADEFKDIISTTLTKLHDEIGHPMLAKYIAYELMGNLMAWHTARGAEEFKGGDPDCGTSWLRDAGKLQAAMSTLYDVVLPDDFLWAGQSPEEVEEN